MPISYIPGQGGSEQDACTQWLNNPVSLPMPECHGFCMENPSDTTTCGIPELICTKMLELNIAQSGTIPDEESYYLGLWGTLSLPLNKKITK